MLSQRLCARTLGVDTKSVLVEDIDLIEENVEGSAPTLPAPDRQQLTQKMATLPICERWPKTATPAGRKQPHVIVL